MKILRILTILLFCTVIALPLLSQDIGDTNPGVKPVLEEMGQKNSVPGDIHSPEEENASGVLPEKGDVKIREAKVNEDKKEPAKPRTLKKNVAEEKIIDKKRAGDPVFLRIDEGNFKYSRIPELAVSEVKAPVKTVDADIDNLDNSGSEALSSDASDEAGFLGMKKGTADIVTKIGILLLILIVFILYKSRMKGTSKKAPGRNVLNSYRK